MDKIFNKIKFVSSKFFSKKVNYEKKFINSKKDWNVMLVVSNVIIIFFAVYAFYVYRAINNDRFVVIDPLQKEVETKLNTETLKRIVKDINDRTSETLRVRNSSTPSDPSF